MNETRQSAVIFALSGQLFAVDNSLVKEVLWLPALVAMEEQPAYIVGAFDLRGKLIRVVDLNLRLGRPRTALTSSQIVVITHAGEERIGLIGDELIDNGDIALIDGKASTVDGLVYRPLAMTQFDFDGRMGTLLDPQELVASDRFPFEHLIERHNPLDGLSEQQLALLNERQVNYRLVDTDEDTTATQAIVIAALSGEIFGFPVSMIRELAYLQTVFPLPGTPGFVRGNVNLRGEIVTVFDISGLLGVESLRLRDDSRLIVMVFEQQLIGLLVDELIDVTTIDESLIREVPVAVPDARRDLLRGEYRFQNRPLLIVDIEHIFASGQLIVEQE